MEDFATPFIALIDRVPADLSADERECLEYYFASVNIAEGLSADTVPRAWCLIAQIVGRIAHMLGGLPKPGDPGATPEILEWIRAQSRGTLNTYQRARLAALPGFSLEP